MDFNLGIGLETAENSLSSATDTVVQENVAVPSETIETEVKSQESTVESQESAEAQSTANDNAEVKTEDKTEEVTEPKVDEKAEVLAPEIVEEVPEFDKDEDLTDAEKEALKTVNEKQVPRYMKALKNARFRANFLNPNFPTEQVTKQMHDISPSRFNEIKRSMYADDLKNQNVMVELYEADKTEKKEQFVGIVKSFIEDDTARDFLSKVAGSLGYELAPKVNADFAETIGEALEADFTDLETLDTQAPNFMTKVRELIKENEKLKSTAPQSNENTELPKLTNEPDEATQQAEYNQRFEAEQNHFAETFLSPALAQMGIKVDDKASEQERWIADTKEDVLMENFGQEFIQYYKDNTEFTDLLGRFQHALMHNETANIREVQAELAPYARAYMNVRVNEPRFQFVNNAFNYYLESQKTPKKTKTETVPINPKVSPPSKETHPYMIGIN